MGKHVEFVQRARKLWCGCGGCDGSPFICDCLYTAHDEQVEEFFAFATTVVIPRMLEGNYGVHRMFGAGGVLASHEAPEVIEFRNALWDALEALAEVWDMRP